MPEPVQYRQRNRDDHQLADFDAEIECQQGEGDVVFRQSDFGERTGKAETVEQAE